MRITDVSQLSDNQKRLLADSIAKQEAKKATTTPQNDFKPLADTKGHSNTTESVRKPLKTFILKTKLISQNNGRGHHWSKSNKLRTHYQEVITYSGFAQKAAPENPQELTITRILGAKEKSWDLPNIPLACKELIDALVATNNLKDDNPDDLVKVSYKQDKTDRSLGPAIRIELQDSFTTS